MKCIEVFNFETVTKEGVAMCQVSKSPKSLFSYLLMLVILIVFTGCSSTTTIYHGLDERDANDILVYLDNKGIKSYKIQAAATGGGAQKEILWDIAVPNEDEKHAMALLRAAGLPRRAGQSLLTIFEKGGLVPSELEEKIRYEAGLGEQIASTIRKIDGVLDAEVQLSFPEDDPLNPERKKGDVTASVYVKHTGVLDDPNTQLIPKIRRLVASAIQGLKFENVTVIPDKARYADISLREQRTRQEAEKEWVRVWTVVLAKESSSRFQTIFFTFLIIILLLFVFVGWTFWKIHRLLPGGGVKQYFTFIPFKPTAEAPEEEEEEPEEDEETVSEKEPVETEAPPEELEEVEEEETTE
ncbi:MAG: Nodulation protein NolT [Chlamydiae bacterium]|nr:Nodulation protein NolT [Chlamydiota bacterium]